MKYYLISNNMDTLTGLRLCGITGEIVHNEEDFQKALDNVLADDDIGILLIAEKLQSMCRQQILDIKLNRRKPLIVVIPDRHGTGRAADSITSYIKNAIGVKI